jgi:hypothetical protein
MKLQIILPLLVGLTAGARLCTAQLVETNVALNKPTAGDVAFGFPTSNGNDGLTSTFNHADNVNPPPSNPFWTVDLEGLFDLVRIEIVDRLGCCDPNRLNGSEIRLLDSMGIQIGAPLVVAGLPPSSPDETTGTLSFDNGGAGWTGVAGIRVDGYNQYFQFSELRAISLQPPGPAQPRNVAMNGFARASGTLWPGTAASNIVDGNPATFAHPEAAAGTLGFTFTVDLLYSYMFEKIEILNRSNCCPERLSNYRVRLHGDDGSGQPGAAVWTTDVRTDGTDSGLSGVDLLTADLDPAGTFAGRFITIENLNDFEYSPQIAEVRAFTFDPVRSDLATGKPVTCHDAGGQSVPTWPGFPTSHVTDGLFATITHPLDQFSSGYYFEIDLGAEMAIGSILLSGRLDGCCPERLTDPTLQILDDASNSVGMQVMGVITEPIEVDLGNVTGRYLRIINTNGADYGPQISELRVYPPAVPTSPFQITSLVANPATGDGTVTFTSEPGAVYSLFSSANLVNWTVVSASITSDGAITVENFHDDALVGALSRYYRVRRN